MSIDFIDRDFLGGTGVSPSHVKLFLDKIDEIIAAVNDGPLLEYLVQETKVGDEGINCTGELHVGQPGDGRN